VVKVLVLDSDGVVNLFPDEKFSSRFAKEYSKDARQILRFFSEGSYDKCLVGEADVEDELERYVEGTSWSVESLLSYWHEGDSLVDARVLNVVEKLTQKGVSCYMATNQANTRTKYMKDTLGFSQLFEEVFSSADIGYKKPDPLFYDMIFCDLLKMHPGLKPRDVLFFDDKEQNIFGARNAGWEGHLYNSLRFGEFKEIIESFLL
jgi:HAD superfamily hydrolase (TIGR01509 family)